MAADVIASAIVNTGLTVQDEITVIPATPKDGDPDAPILPHTNLILCTSSQLKDKIIADPNKVKVMHIPFVSDLSAGYHSHETQ
jgi:hypothetical protein